MKPLSLLFSAVGMIAMSLSHVQAQEQSSEVKVTVTGVKVQAQNTPQFNVQNVVDKRWKPKVWLEMDVEFKAIKAPKEGDKSPVIDSLEFRYFVGLNKSSAVDNKPIMLTANVTYNNIIEKEDQHALAFVAPSALTRVLEKTNFSTADVGAVGVEIYKGGALAGWHSTKGQRWWSETEKFSVVSDVVLAKPKTPFATLWGDYDLEAAE